MSKLIGVYKNALEEKFIIPLQNLNLYVEIKYKKRKNKKSDSKKSGLSSVFDYNLYPFHELQTLHLSYFIISYAELRDYLHKCYSHNSKLIYLINLLDTYALVLNTLYIKT